MINTLRNAGLFVMLITLSSCAPLPTLDYPDGTYRGVFIDRDQVQVNVEFRLENGIMTRASFRHLYGGAKYRLGVREEPFRSVVQQYQEALDHLVGKHLTTHLADLYTPEDIITTEVDGFSAATMRSSKILSAIQDALNRGPYSL